MTRSSRAVSFAGSSVLIESAGARAGRIVEFLFRDVPDDPSLSSSATFLVHASNAGRTFTVSRDAFECYSGSSQTDAARVLLEAVSFALSEGCAGGLLFHAAAVSRAGRVVLLPGTTGAGKTTLTARLITTGFRYLTDELSYLPDGALTLHAFSRPLNVKASGLALLPRPVGRTGSWASLASEAAVLVQPPSARVARQGAAATLAAIVFPRHQPAAPPQLTPIGKAEAGLRLMACLLNARNRPAHGFHAIADLVRRVPSYELQYAESEQAAFFLHELAGSGETTTPVLPVDGREGRSR